MGGWRERAAGVITALLALVLLESGAGVLGTDSRAPSHHQGFADGAEGENIRLPGGINTAQGWMDVESKYIPGVVRAEIGGVTGSAAALRAQAVAARTYLLLYLNEKGMGATVPIGPQFQAWVSSFTARELDAAAATRGVVMTHAGLVINANYASGAKVDPIGAPYPPDYYGYCSDVRYTDWDTMREAFRQGRRFTGANNYCGAGNAWAWTEIYVTPGDGSKTLQNWPDARNRGALGQWKTKSLGEAGWSEDRILRHFYSCIDLVSDLGLVPAADLVPIGGRHCSVPIGPPAG